jgi:predicted metal-dependent hydrolase
VKSKEKNNGFNFICIPSSSGPMIIPYRIERSRRVKRMHLQVDSGQVVLLKMPLRQAEHHGRRFIQENGDWICQTLAAQPRVPRLRTYLMRNPRISLNGRWYRLEMGYGKTGAQFLVQERERTVVLTLNPGRSTEDQMLTLLREMARKFLAARVEYWSSHTGIRVHGVTVRDQKSRWGSCSETGGISLNWRLILIAPKLQDHVILHELAHLRHFDHSKSFHQFLKSLDPRAEQHARELDGDISRIISLGRAAS